MGHECVRTNFYSFTNSHTLFIRPHSYLQNQIKPEPNQTKNVKIIFIVIIINNNNKWQPNKSFILLRFGVVSVTNFSIYCTQLVYFTVQRN